MTKLMWHRDGQGRQASACGRYAVQSDGYEPGQHVGADAHYEGFVAGEWAAIVVATDNNLDWFPTMREAKAECQRHANRQEATNVR